MAERLSSARLGENLSQLVNEVADAFASKTNSENLKLLRQGSNIVLADQTAEIVIRVHLGKMTTSEVAERNRLVRHLTENGFPSCDHWTTSQWYYRKVAAPQFGR